MDPDGCLIFQSTLPAWGATPVRFPALRQFPYFNPRSPHGERHASGCGGCTMPTFQSTLPAWGATGTLETYGGKLVISIHAPRMGSDFDMQRENPTGYATFNPRFPHGERPTLLRVSVVVIQFQSTLPAWGATESIKIQLANDQISIHAPRMGSDKILKHKMLLLMHFNPRSPHGERLSLLRLCCAICNISIHAPRMGSDMNAMRAAVRDTLFQSTLPAWGATPASF